MKKLILTLIFVLNVHPAFTEPDFETFLLLNMPSGDIAQADDREMDRTVQIYAKRQVSEDVVVLLYAATQTGPHSGDKGHTVYLSTANISGDSPAVLSSMDITDRLASYTEYPGHFSEMDGVMDSFEMPGGKKGIHVNLWSVLAGSGHLSSSSDLFMSIQPDFSLQPVLSLPGSSSYSKVGFKMFSSCMAYLFYGDIDADSGNEILALDTQYRSEEPHDAHITLNPTMRVFKFNGQGYVPAGAINMFEEAKIDVKPFHFSKKIMYFNVPAALNSLFDCQGS
ncbi:hypothetical protein [Desulfoluna spongiiphila]|uniref:hypothetical protein n=1 Tax=Desulfoluna spongiiphila TaxID=419481 RepID=UPI0012527C48|nr:hypothetical protein [Desulfoluna spongiiphila]VVS90982.1 hypothetical protein DBB_5500 [Desulfoluna spongiiphila]